MKYLLIFGIIALSACTSDRYAPINQSTPIRQMDNAFEGRPLNAPPPGYGHDRRYGPDSSYDRPRQSY